MNEIITSVAKINDIRIILNEFKNHIRVAHSILEIDEKLTNALFKPAIVSGIFYFNSNELEWMNECYRYKGDSFLQSLLRLSEYYQNLNSPLSAALWGIWNTSNYMRNNRSIFFRLFENKKQNETFFISLRAIVATAAIQFADGNALTTITSDAYHNIEEYKKYAENALSKLSLHLPQ